MAPSFYVALTLVVIIIKIFPFFGKKNITQPSEKTEIDILQKHVVFYQKLTAEEKTKFLKALRNFFSYRLVSHQPKYMTLKIFHQYSYIE